MKLPSLVWLLAALPVLAGCQQYTRLRVTNPRGELIADWVARGYVYPCEGGGYRITAVQRAEGCPMHLVARYPDGWRTTVYGPNIHHWHCNKPAWLDDTR